LNIPMLHLAAMTGKSHGGFSSNASLAQNQRAGRPDLPGDAADDAIACCQTVKLSDSDRRSSAVVHQ
jgi:hypothetical protein